MLKSIILLTVFLSAVLFPQKGGDSFIDAADKFFKTYCVNGSVNYSDVKKNQSEVDDIALLLKNSNLDKAEPLYRKAFYINAYNFLVIKSIAESRQTDQANKIKGFFDTRIHDVAGQKLTLKDIAEKKLRKMFFDSRVHFVLVNGAKSSPRAENFAYKPAGVEDQINSVTRRSLNDARFVLTDKKNKKVFLSEIFRTYKDEFVTAKSGYLDFINPYRIEKIPADYTIEFMEFDWTLNGVK
ncbi:MAG: DUF547 domain-containing protein [Ignavibacteriaceae bacterium]|nr:DUF547 domain-containing protein [Ignavibacteriaceae bacterium]